MRNKGISATFSAIVVLAASWLFSPVVEGRTATGNIQGTVVDTSGAVLPGATIRLTNSGTGFSRVVTANDWGDYQAHPASPAIASGSFQTALSKPTRPPLHVFPDIHPTGRFR